MPTTQEQVRDFFSQGPFGVVGASTDRQKYGNKVLRAYQQKGLEVYPVNPREPEVEGLKAYRDLASLPVKVRGLSIITPPAVTEQVVEEAARLGITHVWMQPGAESPRGLQRAEALGLRVIAGGPCLLVLIGFHEP